MNLDINSNINKMVNKLNDFQKKQIPFATSRAINDAALAAQATIVGRVQNVFKNRRKWYAKTNTKTGIRVKFSKKSELRVLVYTNAYFSKIQEKGGVKRPRGKKLAIPVTGTPKKLRRSDGARKALKDPKVFANKKGIYKKMAKRRIKMLFNWQDMARIKPVFGFEKTFRKTVAKILPRAFAKRLTEAIKTAKK